MKSTRFKVSDRKSRDTGLVSKNRVGNRTGTGNRDLVGRSDVRCEDDDDGCDVSDTCQSIGFIFWDMGSSVWCGL